MRAYFEDPARKVFLLEAAEAWRGTPFVPHAKLKGAGVDCVHLCAAIYISCGCMRQFDPPAYSLDGGHHQKSSKVVEWVRESGKFIEVGQAEVGDLLCFQIGRVEHHVGIVLTASTFVHAAETVGVAYGNLGDSTWLERLRKIYRPVEL